MAPGTVGVDIVISGSFTGRDRCSKRRNQFVQDGKRLGCAVPCDEDEQATTEATPTKLAKRLRMVRAEGLLTGDNQQKAF